MSTPFLDRVYAQVDFDRELVFKFFTIFSLFEYALKQTNFRTIGRSGEAQPDWEGFANNINPQFDIQATPDLVAAVNYMLSRPVMKQTLRNNALVFIRRHRPNNMNDAVWLSVLIRGVRNNLFHGGKFRYDRPRDPELIQHSMTILEVWSQYNNDVRIALETV